MTNEQLKQVMNEANRLFQIEIQKLVDRKLLKKKQSEDMIAGCRDGVRSVVSLL